MSLFFHIATKNVLNLFVSEKKWLSWAMGEELALEKMPKFNEIKDTKLTVEKWLLEVGF
jgi:hypothetical protein